MGGWYRIGPLSTCKVPNTGCDTGSVSLTRGGRRTTRSSARSTTPQSSRAGTTAVAAVALALAPGRLHLRPLPLRRAFTSPQGLRRSRFSRCWPPLSSTGKMSSTTLRTRWSTFPACWIGCRSWSVRFASLNVGASLVLRKTLLPHPLRLQRRLRRAAALSLALLAPLRFFEAPHGGMGECSNLNSRFLCGCMHNKGLRLRSFIELCLSVCRLCLAQIVLQTLERRGASSNDDANIFLVSSFEPRCRSHLCHNIMDFPSTDFASTHFPSTHFPSTRW